MHDETNRTLQAAGIYATADVNVIDTRVDVRATDRVRFDANVQAYGLHFADPVRIVNLSRQSPSRPGSDPQLEPMPTPLPANVHVFFPQQAPIEGDRFGMEALLIDTLALVNG